MILKQRPHSSPAQTQGPNQVRQLQLLEGRFAEALFLHVALRSGGPRGRRHGEHPQRSDAPGCATRKATRGGPQSESGKECTCAIGKHHYRQARRVAPGERLECRVADGRHVDMNPVDIEVQQPANANAGPDQGKLKNLNCPSRAAWV